MKVQRNEEGTIFINIANKFAIVLCKYAWFWFPAIRRGYTQLTWKCDFIYGLTFQLPFLRIIKLEKAPSFEVWLGYKSDNITETK